MEDKTNWSEILNKNGIWAFVLLAATSFILNQIFLTVKPFISVIILLTYICWIFYIEFNKKVKSPFNVERKMVFGFLIIIPLLITVMTLVLLFYVKEYSSTKIIEFFTKNDSYTFILMYFAIISMIGYFVLLMYSKICNTHNGESHCKYEGNGEVKKQLSGIMDVLEKRSQIAYTATCIPIKYISSQNKITVVLINNKSHSKSPWMFPGSHVDMPTNLSIQEELNLQEITCTPEIIVIDKVKTEAGINDIKLLDPNYSYIEPHNSVSYPNSCWPVVAPAFNYLFKVSENAKCYKKHNHRCHYDFTYIGEYTSINESEAEYETIEIELDIFKIDENERMKGINYINNIIVQSLNQRSGLKRKNQHIGIGELCLDSIPEMIYNALLFYKRVNNI